VNDRFKHRLLGAAILIALGVLLLPGFFRDKDSYHVDTTSRIPTKPSVTAIDFDGPTPVENIEAAPAPETMFVPEEISEPFVDAASSSSSSASSIPNTASSAIPKAWVIQVGSFGHKEAAEKLLKELQTEGHKAYMRSAMTDKGTMHRLFIGPKIDLGDAEAVKQAVDKRWNLQSRIYPYKP
jgi:DedD protein